MVHELNLSFYQTTNHDSKRHRTFTPAMTGDASAMNADDAFDSTVTLLISHTGDIERESCEYPGGSSLVNTNHLPATFAASKPPQIPIIVTSSNPSLSGTRIRHNWLFAVAPVN